MNDSFKTKERNLHVFNRWKTGKWFPFMCKVKIILLLNLKSRKIENVFDFEFNPPTVGRLSIKYQYNTDARGNLRSADIVSLPHCNVIFN